jgi:hypothetical protein
VASVTGSWGGRRVSGMTRVTWGLGGGRGRGWAADLEEWRGWSQPGPFEIQIFCLAFGSELVVGPGSDTVLTQRRSDPADRPGATRDWHADVAQLVEHHLAKVRVAGSNPVVRSEARLCGRLAAGQTRSCGGVAEWLRQGPAKPCTRVRFPSPPPPLSVDQRELPFRALVGCTAVLASRSCVSSLGAVGGLGQAGWQ